MTTKPRKPSDGEAHVMRTRNLTLNQVRVISSERDEARRIDRLCARVRREERQRCLKIVSLAAADERELGGITSFRNIEDRIISGQEP